MDKTELEKAIKNGDSVWFVDNCNEKVWEIDLNEKYKPEIYLDQILYVYQNTNDRFKQELFIENIFKTKAEAEHYLNHANIYRTEQLPFLTWEEFRSGKELIFIGKDTYKYILKLKDDEFKIILEKHTLNTIEIEFESEATEENFYSCYDECVKLFKGE